MFLALDATPYQFIRGSKELPGSMGGTAGLAQVERHHCLLEPQAKQVLRQLLSECVTGER